MSYTVGVDIGGTCTDCVVVDESGTMTLAKALSTPGDFSEGVLAAVTLAAEEVGVDLPSLLGETRFFLHSTTVAENAVVEGSESFATGALLVTRGFEDMLVLSRGGYGRWAGFTAEEKKDPINTDKPDPLVPRTRTRGIKERTDARGEVLHGVDEAEVEQAVHELVDDGAETLGVSLLWSCVNPENENAVRRVVERLYPDRFFTAGSAIAPTLGEFERTQSVAMNIRLGPFVSRYLESLERKLQERGLEGTLLVMQTHGGLLELQDASKQPVALIESGPVAGLVGSKSLAHVLGYENIIAADMGGTTFKTGIVRKGLIEYQREPIVHRHPYAIPKMDVATIGHAGGSIIWIDPLTERPQVGPRSAGADPGPVCYGRGGEEPTVTDVDLLLGYLNPDFFLGGHEQLTADKPLQAFKKTVADPLGLEVDEALIDIYRLTNSLLFDELHKITVERGLDLRDYLLFAYGGTAGMHLPAVAAKLGITKIVVPHTAAVHCAFGLASGDVVHESHVTRPMRGTDAAEAVNATFRGLTEKAREQLAEEGFDSASTSLSRSIDMRFKRQIHQIAVPLDSEDDDLTNEDLEAVYDRFERMYKERYGRESAFREAGIELVAFRVRAVGEIVKPELTAADLGDPDPSAAFLEERTVYFESINDVTEARGYDFEKLQPGNVVQGPAIIWSPITTIVVSPGQTAACDGYKNIVISTE